MLCHYEDALPQSRSCMTLHYNHQVILVCVCVCSLGDDLESLLFHFLDEFLFLFSAEPYFIPKVIPWECLCNVY